MAERCPPPPGLDYVPIAGTDPNLIFGVIRSALAGVQTNALAAVFRRLFPVDQPADPYHPWPKPTCYRYDVLLPPAANNDYTDPETLCRAYLKQARSDMKDQIIIVSFRFPETVAEPPAATLHSAYERCRSFSYQRLCIDRGLAVVLCMHLPHLAAGKFSSNVPHVHVMALARTMNGAGGGFGDFVRPLATDAGRKIIDEEWAAWRSGGAPPLKAVKKKK